MMPAALYAILAVAVVSVISLIGAITVAIREEALRRLLPFLVALAAGALFGGAVLHLIPEAFEEVAGNAAPLAVLAGILTFFILEHILRWHHHHRPHTSDEDCVDCEQHVDPMGPLVLTADALHNILDGAIIAGAFLVSIELGIATTIAVALHEIPQEIGDFGVLVYAGFTKLQALAANLVSALTAFIGVGLVFVFASAAEQVAPILAAFAGGGFLYIAAADLVPELHSGTDRGIARTLLQLLVLFLGIAAMYALLFLE